MPKFILPHFHGHLGMWYTCDVMPTRVSVAADLERELLAYIASGDKKNAKRILNDILGHIFFSSSHELELY